MAVWLSSIAYFMGGGPRTASILILAMVSDIDNSNTRFAIRVILHLRRPSGSLTGFVVEVSCYTIHIQHFY